jgi:hypothetical protein
VAAVRSILFTDVSIVIILNSLRVGLLCPMTQMLVRQTKVTSFVEFVIANNDVK